MTLGPFVSTKIFQKFQYDRETTRPNRMAGHAATSLGAVLPREAGEDVSSMPIA
jgi:hypothetical protein